MTDRSNPQISQRKQPQQARSADLVAAVLTAAVQVLVEEGVAKFTVVRVAERAGVSVGSLYQYFPSKTAILFKLQSEEWLRTSALLRGILADPRQTPPERLRLLVHAFLRSECEEAAVRSALGDAAPRYRDAPEAETARAAADGIFRTFAVEAMPALEEPTRTAVANLIETTLRDAGRRLSATPRTPDEIAEHAELVSGMFGAWLEQLAR